MLRISTVSVYRSIPTCKFTLGDAERVSNINTQIAQLRVAAISLSLSM